MIVRQQPHHLPHPYRELLVILGWRVMSPCWVGWTTVGCWVLLYSWYHPKTLFRVLDRRQVWWSTFHVETRWRLVLRIPAGSLDPCCYGSDDFLFATRHLIVVCTQTCIFRCCICIKAVVCLLYEMLYPCSCNVVISCWNPGHMASSYVAVGSICASSSDLDGNVQIWNSTLYRALQLGIRALPTVGSLFWSKSSLDKNYFVVTKLVIGE